MRGKLNLFQATMLRWRELHPYSAVHVVRITRALEAARDSDSSSKVKAEAQRTLADAKR